MRCAVFSCMGLGDGLLATILSKNLASHGHEVDTFHPFMHQLQGWFPDLPLKPFPSLDALAQYDRFFIVYERSPWMEAILALCLEKYRKETTVLNPIATPLHDYPYWEEGRFDGNLPFAENLVRFSSDLLGLTSASKDNGLRVPSGITPHKYPNRVVIHPTSSRMGKNWTLSKYLQLAEKLEKRGFEPAFILTKEERAAWPHLPAPALENLEQMASFVAESGWMIGNDSGIGHLASCLGLPTLIICRSQMAANFWRPDWKRGMVLYPPKWIPNLKGLRWRDKKWQHFVPVSRVLKAFEELVEEESYTKSTSR